jgi:hypothetical protein
MTPRLLAGQFALVTAAAFAVAAIYVSVAEQPARLALDDKAMLAEWKPSYARASVMQAGLALASALAGLLVLWITRDWRWMLGALLILANWPYTLLVIMPVNRRIKATAAQQANAETRTLILRWGTLHAGRSLLGVAATVVYAGSTT